MEVAIGYAGRMESTILLEDPEVRDVTTIVDDEEQAKTEADRARPGLTMFTGGSRLDSGATGYAAVLQEEAMWLAVSRLT